jgi:hypothetical protein
VVHVRPRAHFVPALLVAVMAAGLAATLVNSSGARAAASSLSVDQFKIGLGCVESAGDYRARNSSSGAFGKYQVMPSNWPVWAGTYLGDRKAKQTPRHQETVVSGEVLFLRQYLQGGWPRVAHWWLTGSTDGDRSHWSAVARHYVDRVMTYGRASRTPKGTATIPKSCLSTPATAALQDRVARVRLRLRDGPSADTPILGWVRAGSRMSILERRWDVEGRRWYRVSLQDGRKGWVAGRLTRPA